MNSRKNSRLTLIRNYIGQRPFFFKIMFILIAIVFTLILAFYIFAQRRRTDILLDQYYSAQESNLNNAVKNVNSSMSSVKALARITLFNSNVMQSVISPDPLLYTENLAVVRVLSNTADQNPLIDYISLYVKRTSSVYDSNESINTLNSCALKDVWDYYFSEPVQKTLNDSYESAIISYAGRVYLVQGYSRYLHFSNAIMLLRISPSLFSENIVDELTAVYDGDGVLLYGPDSHDRFIHVDDYQSDTIYHLDSIEHTGIGLYYTDPETGWQYLYEIDEPGNMSSEVLRLAALTLIVLGIGIAACVLLSINLYRPINQLIETTKNMKADNMAVGERQSEFDYLKATYADLIQNKSALENLFPFMYTVAAEKYFEALLFGSDTPLDELVGRLDTIAGSLGFFDHFLVVIATTDPYTDNEADELKSLIASAIPDDSSEYMRKLCVINRPALGVITVLAFNNHSDPERIDYCFKSWTSEMARRTQLPVSFYRGNVCDNIQDTKLSFEESCANTIFGRYSAAQKLPGLSTISGHESYVYQIWTYCETLENNSEEVYAQQCRNLCDRIYQNFQTPHDASVLYAFFIYELSDKMRQLELISKDGVAEDYRTILHYSDVAKLHDYAEETIFHKASSIFRYYHAANYSYVKAAIEYIEEHFTDTSLSLNEVSQAININASYLSHLFTSTVGQSFVYYVNSYRVNQARNLLSNSEVQIQDIGMIVGFNNMTTFYRVFKKYTGMTPKAYREKTV